MSDRLSPGEYLIPGQSITSQDGRFVLVLQSDGNLVLYGPGNRYRWDTGTNGREVGQAVMQGDGNFVMYGPGGEYIWDTATDGRPGAWLVIQSDGNLVMYDAGGNPIWASNTNIIQVPGFQPSTSGFHFSNSFPSVPLFTIDVLGQKIPIGDASNGLCGGMVFAVRDFFEARISVPTDTTAPSGGALFNYIVQRLFDSFNLFLPPSPFPVITPTPPFGPGPTTYMWLMNPELPDHETIASNLGLAPRGRAWVMINEQWPQIRADLDHGVLSPLALVEIKSWDPMQMGHNHQVLAYAYDLIGTDLVIYVYDPNHPNNNNVTLSLNIGDPQHTTQVNYSDGSMVYCFFRPSYAFAYPPTLEAQGAAMQSGEMLNPG